MMPLLLMALSIWLAYRGVKRSRGLGRALRILFTR